VRIKESVLPPKPVFMNVKIVFFAAASLLNAALLFAGDKPNTADPRQVAASVGRLLELGPLQRMETRTRNVKANPGDLSRGSGFR